MITIKDVIQDLVSHGIFLPRTKARLSSKKMAQIVLAYAQSVGFTGKANNSVILRFVNEYYHFVRTKGKKYYMCVPNPAFWQEEEEIPRKDLFFVRRK